MEASRSVLGGRIIKMNGGRGVAPYFACCGFNIVKRNTHTSTT